jgi:hypothetical protein
MDRDSFTKKELAKVIYVDLTVEEALVVCTRLKDHVRRIDKELDRGLLSKNLTVKKEKNANQCDDIIDILEVAITTQLAYDV